MWQNTRCYFENEAACKELLTSVGWLRTGDVAFYDDGQRFFNVDRMRELIKVKGLQVFPAEMEDLIREHREVEDVAVVGIPHQRLGEAPRAYVVPRQGARKIFAAQAKKSPFY